MTPLDRTDIERRVLLLAPNGNDAELTLRILAGAQVQALACTDSAALACQAASGAGAILITEECLADELLGPVAELLKSQPPWSDMPILILAHGGQDFERLTASLPQLGNVTLLERPVRVAAMVTAVRSALRARERQYQIREYIADQKRSEQALRAADRRKDEFLATLAHELRNPLAPIRNSLHILRIAGPEDPQVRQVREMMERQVNHMTRLVDDLMEVSRITRGKIELRKEMIELAGVVATAVETSRPLIDAARHHLAISIPPDPILVEADPVRLAQVFANLLNNAAKYTEPGGRIWLTVSLEGCNASVSVRDSGMGIPADSLPQVFDLFTQVNNARHRTQGGLGIGLTLVRSLVQLHGGIVQAASEGPGRGSEFTVRLPVARQPERPESTRPADRGKSALEAMRVLVVDDNRDAAETLGMLIRMAGPQVRIEHSGAAALQAIVEFRPTVAILDIGMPNMDGYEVARRIGQLPMRENMTLIALTGWGQDDDRRRSKTAGFDHHLVKPVDLDELESLIRGLAKGSEPPATHHIAPRA